MVGNIEMMVQSLKLGKFISKNGLKSRSEIKQFFKRMIFITNKKYAKDYNEKKDIEKMLIHLYQPFS